MGVPMRNISRSITHGLLAVVVMVSLLAASSGSAFAETANVPPPTLTGSVTVSGSTTPVADATVVATQSGATALVVKGNTNVSGSYGLALGDGDWQIVVKPHQTDPNLSPTWVYTAGVQSVTIQAATTLDLKVDAATATITGRLIVPDGTTAGTTFSAGNAASVRAANQEGQGNTVQVKADGSFSLNVLPGNVMVRLGLSNPDWAPGSTLAGSIWTLAGGDNFDIIADPSTGINPLQLLAKLATISGLVKNDQGILVTGLAIPVKAWRVDGSEVETGVTDLNGQYSLKVLNGDWFVAAAPLDTQPFVGVDSPKMVSILDANGTKTQDLAVSSADVSVTGEVVDQTGASVPNLKGRVIPTYLDKDGIHWRQFVQGAAIVPSDTKSTYTLKLSSAEASHYRLHAAFNNLQGYTEITAPVLNLLQGVTSYPGINLPIAANNSSIAGHFVDQAAVPQTGVPGAIYGKSDGGAFAMRRVNPVDASYLFNVAATSLNGNGGTFWWLHAFVDPTSGFSVIHPATQKVFLPAAGINLTDIDFTLAHLDATLQGIVTDPQGTPVRGAKVGLWEQNIKLGKAFTRWAMTDKDGKYSVKVPAGSYKIGVDTFRFTSPEPVMVTVAANQTIIKDMQFRPNNAWILGKAAYNGLGHPAMIRAHTNDGAHATAMTDKNGNYALHVNAGVAWFVQAVSEDDADFLRSPRMAITPKACSLISGDCLAKNLLNLDLQLVDRLPEAVVFKFDATQNQIFTLSDGAQVIIPANAMADSGFVNLIVRPLPELADDGVATPVSFGYRLLAYDASMMPIDHFSAAVTLVMPFMADQLSKLGVSADNLIPQYWDLPSNSFKPVQAFSVTVDSSGNGSLNLNVEHFTDYALTAGYDSHLWSNQLYLPSIVQ